MKQMQGKQSILFQNPVKILSHACVGGKKEGEGPIGKHLDLIKKTGKRVKVVF